MKFEKGIVKEVVEIKPRTIVKPQEFFISWSGVPTLAYQGFTKPLLDIKNELERRISGIKPENPGSKWPKTTLGALRDDKQLSLDDLFVLRKICDELNGVVSEKNIVFNINTLQLWSFNAEA